MVIRYQVFMTDLILSFDLVDNQFGVTISFKILYSHLLSSWRPISKTLYSATLLEQGSVKENAPGRM